MGMLLRQAARSLIKLIPGVGSLVGSITVGALAGASTFALGKAFCYYYRAVHEGHVPRPEDLRRYYKEQLALAEQAWSGIKSKTAAVDQHPPAGTVNEPGGGGQESGSGAGGQQAQASPSS